MSEHVGGRVMLVGERRKLLIFMNGSLLFTTIGRAHLVIVHRHGDRPGRTQAYRDRGKLAALTSGWMDKSANPVHMNCVFFPNLLSDIWPFRFPRRETYSRLLLTFMYSRTRELYARIAFVGKRTATLYRNSFLTDPT